MLRIAIKRPAGTNSVTVPIWPEWVLGTPHRAVREQTLGTLTLEPLLTETGASLLTETGDTLHA